MQLAWAVTGAGHFLQDSYDVFKELTLRHHITTLISSAGEEVLQMYGLHNKLVKISGGDYLEEIFRESEQGRSFPKAGRFLLGRYDALIVAPATSNTVAKIAYGIADTLPTNAVAQAVKGGVPVYIVPVDIAGDVVSEMPYSIDRLLCEHCDDCPPARVCPKNAITDYQIELLKCTGCGMCVEVCRHEAINGGPVKLRVRDVDMQNVETLRKLDGIEVVEKPQDLLDLF